MTNTTRLPDAPEIHWPPEMDADERAALQEILVAYDEALTEFESDHRAIFPSDAERNRILHGFLERWAKAWSKPGPCMHSGCTKNSIARSHTISLGTSIRLIAENGHVLTPRFGAQGLDLVPVGVKEASTFPGFCTEHEAQFSVFENQKQMTEEAHFRLQAFRTICREIYSRTHQQQKAQAMLNEHRRLRDAFIIGRMQAVSIGGALPNIPELRFENDEIDEKLVDLLSQIQADLPELQGLYDSLQDEIQNGVDKVSICVRDLNFQLPVCLSGIGVLNYKRHGKAHRGLCFITILPEAERTKIMIGAERQHADAVEHHINDDGSLAVLAMLESWMIHGSDHWFMKPSAWASIPHDRQRAICERILEPLSLADRAPFSVLDGARTYIVAHIESLLSSDTLQPADRATYEKIRSDEQAKLRWSPEPHTATPTDSDRWKES